MRLKIENIYFCLLSPVHLFQFWNKVSFENQHLEMTLVNQNAILTGEKTKKKKKRIIVSSEIFSSFNLFNFLELCYFLQRKHEKQIDFKSNKFILLVTSHVGYVRKYDDGIFADAHVFHHI